MTLQIVVVSLLNYPQLYIPPYASMNFPLKTHFRPPRERTIPPTDILQTLLPASPSLPPQVHQPFPVLGDVTGTVTFILGDCQ